MRYLSGVEEEKARQYCRRAAELARNSLCRMGSHGAVLVRDGKIIGEGWNTPVPDAPCEPCTRKDVGGVSLEEMCHSVHAEENAWLDALGKGNEVAGSVLYHARLKDWGVSDDNTPECTRCSRMLRRLGVAGVVLIDGGRFAYYAIDEFDAISYENRRKRLNKLL